MPAGRVELMAEGPEHLRALMEGEAAYEERFGFRLARGIRDFLLGPEVSPKFLAMLEAATEPDPWTFGFAVVHREEQRVIGMAGFKGPPAEGVVEIAYGIAPDYEGCGYATEVARMLMQFAIVNEEVQTIRAHTLPEGNASTRVLEKNGFVKIGPVEDPEDGTVWRWERGIG